MRTSILPVVRDPRQIPRSASVFEIVVSLVIALVDIRRIVRVKPAAAGLPGPSPLASC